MKIKVIAGILLDNGRVLTAQRSSQDQFGSRWEFPGGKVEAGEAPEKCLKREFFEEFGVTIKVGDFFLKIEHDYADSSIELLAYWIDEAVGDFVLNSHEQIQWVAIKDLEKFNFLDADKIIVRRLMNDEDVVRSRSQTRSSHR